MLLISDTYPPVLGGSEVEAQRIAAAMIGRGHQVHVLCAGGTPMPQVRDWIDPAGVPVSILTRRSEGRVKHWIFAAEVAHALWSRRKTYDLVYFLMQGLHLAAGLPISRFLHKPIVMKIAGSGVVPLMRASRAGRRELDWMREWQVPVMVLNQGMVDEAVADGFRRENLVWMPNPVEISEFRPAEAGEASDWRDRHGIPREAPVAIYVGRLSPEKGLPGLIKGFAHVARRLPEAVLLLLGDGAQRQILEKTARDLNLDSSQIRFLGRVDIGEVPRWLRAADIFALTSPSEGFPCALVEAMSAGLPSVVSDIPANVQLIDDGVHGRVVPYDADEAVGEAFLELFSDPLLRDKMGRAARTRVIENYSTDRVIDRYEKLFAEVLSPQRVRS
jgi:glycosyltransferase involved in cell wall biosynthesis